MTEQTIEIIVTPTGQTSLQTLGFTGASCQQASRFLEQALGQKTADVVAAYPLGEPEMRVDQVDRPLLVPPPQHGLDRPLEPPPVEPLQYLRQVERALGLNRGTSIRPSQRRRSRTVRPQPGEPEDGLQRTHVGQFRHRVQPTLDKHPIVWPLFARKVRADAGDVQVHWIANAFGCPLGVSYCDAHINCDDSCPLDGIASSPLW